MAVNGFFNHFCYRTIPAAVPLRLPSTRGRSHGLAEVARRDQAIADGMTTLKQDGILKCLQGLTDIHEVRRVCIK